MRYTFKHSIQFKNGTSTLPYRSTRWWKTIRGALRAAQKHALGMTQRYDNVAMHALVIEDEYGKFVTNEAA